MDFPQTVSESLSSLKRRLPLELNNPTPKCVKGPRFISPLPICQDSTDRIYLNYYEWPLFTGKYNGNSIIIDDADEVISLSNKGFFGKGSLSRGTPRICRRKLSSKLVTESQWKRRQMWSDSLSGMLQSKLTKPEDSDISQISHSEIVKKENTPPSHVLENFVDQFSDAKINGALNIDCHIVDNNSLSHKEENKLPGFEENLKLVVSESVQIGGFNKAEENSAAGPKVSDDNLSNEKSVIIKNEVIPQSIAPEILVNKDSQLLDDDELLVINDYGLNLEESLINLNPRIEKKKIETVLEVLYLSFEEAFFLSYALNCLQVVDLFQNVISNKELWKLFHENQPDFIEKYVAYHHFRSKGWVVKSGLKFGGDFLLYKKGPAYYHASYIVLVKILNADGTQASNSVTWGEMLTLNRMSESASKEVLICEVMKPALPIEDFLYPDVLKEFKVSELLLRRWHPSNDNDSPTQSSK